MVPQVTATSKSAFYHLRKIRLIRKHLTFDLAQLLARAVVTSKPRSLLQKKKARKKFGIFDQNHWLTPLENANFLTIVK